MPKSCSSDLRDRVIDAVEEGATRREAAERFDVSASSAVRWFQVWQREGRRAPRPCGGSQSPLEDHADQILALVAAQPDWTLDEFVAAMGKRRLAGSRSALWRFLERHGISVKKKACGQPSKTGRTWPGLGGAGSGSRACLIRPPSSSLTKPRRTPAWRVFAVDARGASA